jgi:predicted dehydrogenase
MNVLMMGLGSIGRRHMVELQKLTPSPTIFALRSAQNNENIPGVINIHSLVEVDHHDLDFAIIATPTHKHKNSIEQLIKTGIPLFIEKPLYHSLEVEDLVSQITEKNIITYMACNLRFLESLQFLKKTTPSKKKKLNEINVYCGTYLPHWRPENDFRKTYSSAAEKGGGVHLDLIHELDYLYWIFGMPKSASRYLKSQSSLSITAYDYANYLLEYDGFCANVVLNYYRRDSKRALELVFEDETWEVDLLTNRITTNNKLVYSSSQKIMDTYERQMEYFIECLEDGKKPFNTINDGLNVLRICLNK